MKVVVGGDYDAEFPAQEAVPVGVLELGIDRVSARQLLDGLSARSLEEIPRHVRAD